FAECTEEPNPSVSRRHAHIEAAGSPAEYRLYDDRSAYGTSVQRNGVTIVVPPGPRGIRLQSGDEIALGEARLQVEIETAGVTVNCASKSHPPATTDGPSLTVLSCWASGYNRCHYEASSNNQNQCARSRRVDGARCRHAAAPPSQCGRNRSF